MNKATAPMPIVGGASLNSSARQPASLEGSGVVTEVVNVPVNLANFANDPKFQTILLKVKQQTNVNYIECKREENEKKIVAISINAPNADCAFNAKKLVETHFKNQIRIMSAEAKLAKTQTELFSAQGEVASGMMVDFEIKRDLIGLVIGKGGARIKEVESKTGVTSINVNGDTGKIMVVGPDAGSVQAAREMLELFEDTVPLRPDQVEWLARDRFNGSLTDIRQDNELISARLDRNVNNLIVVGTTPSIRSMRAMLPTQLEYIDKAIEIESTDKLARDQLRDFKRDHGFKEDRRDGPRDYRERRERRDGNDRVGRDGNHDRGDGEYREKRDTYNNRDRQIPPPPRGKAAQRGAPSSARDSVIINKRERETKAVEKSSPKGDGTNSNDRKAGSAAPSAPTSTRERGGKQEKGGNKGQGGSDISGLTLRDAMQKKQAAAATHDTPPPVAAPDGKEGKKGKGGKTKVTMAPLPPDGPTDEKESAPTKKGKKEKKSGGATTTAAVDSEVPTSGDGEKKGKGRKEKPAKDSKAATTTTTSKDSETVPSNTPTEKSDKLAPKKAKGKKEGAKVEGDETPAPGTATGDKEKGEKSEKDGESGKKKKAKKGNDDGFTLDTPLGKLSLNSNAGTTKSKGEKGEKSDGETDTAEGKSEGEKGETVEGKEKKEKKKKKDKDKNKAEKKEGDATAVGSSAEKSDKLAPKKAKGKKEGAKVEGDATPTPGTATGDKEKEGNEPLEKRQRPPRKSKDATTTTPAVDAVKEGGQESAATATATAVEGGKEKESGDSSSKDTNEGKEKTSAASSSAVEKAEKGSTESKDSKEATTAATTATNTAANTAATTTTTAQVEVATTKIEEEV